MAHEHNFEVETPDDYGAEWDGDHGVVAYVYCRELELEESYTDAARDESYEVYGDPCEAMLTLYWSLDEVLVIDDGEERPTVNQNLIEDLLTRIGLDEIDRQFVAMADPLEPGDETVVPIDFNGTTYEVIWVLDEGHING